MEKKRAGSGKFKQFLKKNVYYIIMAVCLLAIAAMITVTVIAKNNSEPEEVVPVGPGNVGSNDNIGDVGNNDNVGDSNNNGGNLDVEPEPTNPTPVQVVFAAPVSDVNVTKDFTVDSLVWHNTLKHYATHSGIDFGGNDGDAVLAAYGGTVTEISYDILNGYTVTVKHSDELTTKYSSLNEPVVVVGQSVAKGEVIGTMGVTATNEYLDGAHVHFTLYKDGKVSDPYDYLSLGDK